MAVWAGVLGLLLGIGLGVFASDFATALNFFSDAFLKRITIIVAPIVFCVVVHGIAGAGDLKKVGGGVKVLIYFEALTTVAPKSAGLVPSSRQLPAALG